MSAPLITLTTDFGEGSLYVAEMKGVIFSLHAEARIVDLTHSIPPQSIRQGALALEQAALRFPPGTIHVAVVDPGVGTARKIVYAEIEGRRFLAPDNGLLGLLARGRPPSQLMEVTNRAFWRETISATFHGRDIFAPVAAHLARGVAPASLGEPLEALTPLDWPQPRAEAGRLLGEVVTIDGFGNLITNLHADAVLRLASPDRLQVTCRDRVVTGLVASYGHATERQLVALMGSSARLELAVVNGDAARELAAQVGEPVLVEAAQ